MRLARTVRSRTFALAWSPCPYLHRHGSRSELSRQTPMRAFIVTAQVSQARSADAQVHDQAEWVGGERSQHIPALLFGGREQRPDDPEISRSVLGAKAAGDLLPQLHHPTIAFGLVVGE